MKKHFFDYWKTSFTENIELTLKVKARYNSNNLYAMINLGYSKYLGRFSKSGLMFRRKCGTTMPLHISWILLKASPSQWYILGSHWVNCFCLSLSASVEIRTHKSYGSRLATAASSAFPNKPGKWIFLVLFQAIHESKYVSGS